MNSSPRSPQLEKTRAQQQRPNTAKNKNKINKFFKKQNRVGYHPEVTTVNDMMNILQTFFFLIFIYLFIYGCFGSSLVHAGFL